MFINTKHPGELGKVNNNSGHTNIIDTLIQELQEFNLKNTIIFCKGVVVFHIVAVYPDSKVHGANMGPIWGPHVGPMNFAIWEVQL